MTKIQKFVAIVKEMDRKNKFGFLASINCSDVDKTDEFLIVNGTLQKYCLGKGLLFVDNNNVDAYFLNRGKFYLNR